MKGVLSGETLRFNPVPPRQHTAFLLLSSEMAKLARQPHSNTDWLALERLCQRVFRAHDYDLQTGSWFILISLRLHGWHGLAEGLTLLSSAMSVEKSQPGDPALQREVLTWCATHLVTPVYTLAPGASESDDLVRAAAALQVLSRMAKNREARGHELLSNLCYFLEVRARSPHNIVLEWDAAQPAQVVCKTPEIESVTVEEQPVEEQRAVTPLVPPVKRGPTYWRWLALGAVGGATAMGLLIAILWLKLQPPALSPHLAPFVMLQKLDAAFQSARSSRQPLTEPQWNEIDTQLQQLALRPAGWLLQEGNQLVRHLNNLQPNNPAVKNWYSQLSKGSTINDVTQSWQEIHQRLDALDQRLLDSERKQRNHMTISELKTEVYSLRRALLKVGTPPAVLIKSLDNKNMSVHHRQDIYKEIESNINSLLHETILADDSLFKF